MKVTVTNFKQSIEYHMGRVHVGTSDAAVEQEIREAIAGKLAQCKHWEMSKATQDACVRYALQCHRKNQDLYAFVMGGH